MNGRFERVEYFVELAEWLVERKNPFLFSEHFWRLPSTCVCRGNCASRLAAPLLVTGSQYGPHIRYHHEKDRRAAAAVLVARVGARPATIASAALPPSVHSAPRAPRHAAGARVGPRHGPTHYELLVRALAPR